MRFGHGRTGWALLAAGGMALSAAAQVTPPSATVEKVSVAVAAGPQAGIDEIQVELAWLADPATFPCQLAARVTAGALEVGGMVPSEGLRQKAIEVAKKQTQLAVVDKVIVRPGSSLPVARTNQDNLCKSATASVTGIFTKFAESFEVSADPSGQVSISGNVPTWDDKLNISRRLSMLTGCSAVANKLNVKQPVSQTAATAPLTQPPAPMATNIVIDGPTQSVIVMPAPTPPAPIFGKTQPPPAPTMTNLTKTPAQPMPGSTSQPTQAIPAVIKPAQTQQTPATPVSRAPVNMPTPAGPLLTTSLETPATQPRPMLLPPNAPVVSMIDPTTPKPSPQQLMALPPLPPVAKNASIAATKPLVTPLNGTPANAAPQVAAKPLVTPVNGTQANAAPQVAAKPLVTPVNGTQANAAPQVAAAPPATAVKPITAPAASAQAKAPAPSPVIINQQSAGPVSPYSHSNKPAQPNASDALVVGPKVSPAAQQQGISQVAFKTDAKSGPAVVQAGAKSASPTGASPYDGAARTNPSPMPVGPAKPETSPAPAGKPLEQYRPASVAQPTTPVKNAPAPLAPSVLQNSPALLKAQPASVVQAGPVAAKPTQSVTPAPAPVIAPAGPVAARPTQSVTPVPGPVIAQAAPPKALPSAVAQAAPKPMPASPAPQPAAPGNVAILQSQLQQRIQAACGTGASEIQVVKQADNRFLVRLRVRSAADGDRVAQKVLELPELAPYQVDLEVRQGQ